MLCFHLQMHYSKKQRNNRVQLRGIMCGSNEKGHFPKSVFPMVRHWKDYFSGSYIFDDAPSKITIWKVIFSMVHHRKRVPFKKWSFPMAPRQKVLKFKMYVSYYVRTMEFLGFHGSPIAKTMQSLNTKWMFCGMWECYAIILSTFQCRTIEKVYISKGLLFPVLRIFMLLWKCFQRA